jgi:serine/threonine protein phosphatase PrpC
MMSDTSFVVCCSTEVYFAGTCAVGCFVDLKSGLVTCANLGDSRAVAGVYKNGKVEAIALSVDHTASNLVEQERIRAEHPGDQNVIVDLDETGEDPDWRVKSIAAFTRSIGDLHLKEKNTSALFNSYVRPDQRILPRPGLKCKKTGVTKPKYISTEPEIKELTVNDGFVIIGCDGVFDEMSSDEAVRIVAWLLSNHDPGEVNIAELFIEETLKRAVHRIASTYEEEEGLTLRDLKARPPGKASYSHRSMLHDDITVIILQFGETKGAQKQVGGSLFNMLQNDERRKRSSDATEMFYESFETQSLMSMSRTKAKREMAVKNSMLDWTNVIAELQADAHREAIDKQIIEMMNTFDDLEVRHLKILFNAVDLDENGTLDREEITRLIRHVIQMDVSPAVIDLAFSEMDIDRSGDVDVDEFIQFFGH